MDHGDRDPSYKAGSLSLLGAVALGTGVMIGAGIFALTGQMAQMTGGMFPLAFLAAAIIVTFSAYSYVKMSNAFPSAGGIAMYLEHAYGRTITTAFHSLLMYFSMVIAQSFLARTFGAYSLQIFGIEDNSVLAPVLGAGLLIAAFLLNLARNQLIEGVAAALGFLKVGGILVFGVVGLVVTQDVTFEVTVAAPRATVEGFIAATALGILAFKGFTTITNSGSELRNPERNVGLAIIISIAACVVIYGIVGFAVAGALSIPEIIETRNYSLAAAARPVAGEFGLWFTVILAMIATAGGVIASIFAVSRMLAMLTKMGLVPHSHFGMPGSIQKHCLVYTVVLGLVLTIFFDLTRIAALGIIFYLIMDMAIHWGLLRHLKGKLAFQPAIPMLAILLDLVVLTGFVWVKLATDPLVVGIAILAMSTIGISEHLFLRHSYCRQSEPHH